MKKNTMRKNLRQSIVKSLGRYIAIVAIIALGAGLFVGLRTTKFDMVATGQQYMDKQNMFDLRLLNTYGWTREHLEAIRQMDGVVDAEGVIMMDALASMGDTAEEKVYRLYAIPDTVNQVYLLGGRMPEAPDECLADGSHATDAILGTTFTIAGNNDADTLDSLRYHTYTIVGYISTPLYMDMSRGTTTLGSGSIASYLYLPKDAFNVDYFTEIDVTIPGDYQIYTDAYDDAMSGMADILKPAITPLAQMRYDQVRQDAEEAYADGMAEYQDGLAAYLEAKEEAEQELETARQELLDGSAEIEENRQTLADGEAQLADAQALLDSNAETLSLSKQTLAESKAEAYAQLADANAELLENYKTVSENLRQVQSGLDQLDDGLAQLNSGIAQLESGLEQLDMSISLLDTLISAMDSGIQTAQTALDNAKANGTVDASVIQMLEEKLQELQAKREEYVQQRQELMDNRETYGKQLEELKAQREELEAQRAEVAAAKATLDDAMAQINDGFLELQNRQTQAENQFAAAEAQLEAAQIQLDTAQSELDSKRQELEDGKAALAEAEQTLADGWEEYQKGRDEADKELADAQLQLEDARQELDDARQTIDSLGEPTVYALGRNTNVGYLALDSNSDIVEGVSKVFPAFFLLVAALVCITTMTRMVEEERTQIGTLKALGYGNGAIISKYLFYAGSAAVLGCGLGVVAGSVVFPYILWQAYSIILNLTPNLVYRLDWALCTLVVVVYTAVTLFVTWYSCRMALREVPAELIRPKPPTSGKKIFLEYLPFWDKISFLNKVMLRNIFRYRQRLAMMLIGIGGCTALLVTGFGIGDSIMDIVAYQFEEVTVYDMQIQFSEAMDPEDQEAFRAELAENVDKIGFLHQSSVELDFDNKTKNVYLLSSDDGLDNFFDLHSGETPLTMPETGQALLSVGMAEAMGIQAGDTISLRNTDMDTLTVTVAEIFDNNVYNYVIVTPETIQEQWGEAPEYQMAYVTVRDGQDVHAAAAKAAGIAGVMNVSVSQDLADQVGSMLDAMNLVVATVVVCAGMLAVIVLYNLTNINITERIREIATIKVLGFNSAESAAYVFKENLLLSAMGAVLGLGGGKLLLDFVMSQIKIDMVWFQSRITFLSLVLAIVLTMLSACVVDFILFFRLEKINMAEALKSVE